jgi:PLD-like domain
MTELEIVQLDFDLQHLPDDTEQLFGVNNTGVVKKARQKAKPTGIVSLKEKLKEEVKLKLKSRIKTINAQTIREHIPREGEFCFFLMSGNCEFVDYITEFIKHFKQKPKNITITTLSLSERTFKCLEKIECQNKINLLVSSYFLSTDTKGVLPKLLKSGELENYEIGFYRNHTKMVLIEFQDSKFLFTGSANLRSSATIEQFCIFNDSSLYDFNYDWITKLVQKYNYKTHTSKNFNTPIELSLLEMDINNF